MTVGNSDSPLRVAIVGAGPAGFYLASHLLRQDAHIKIDLFDRLPTPFGLIRNGVAPDHQKDKSVARTYHRYGTDPNLCFYGGCGYGSEIGLQQLKDHYHQIAFTTGASADRRLGIPGEDLKGSHSATEFVGWYNAHLDFVDHQFDLSKRRVAIIGNGNVAIDVARILGKNTEELATTDIADYALKELTESAVKDIHLIGRRGPVQAAFSTREMDELLSLRELKLHFNRREPDELSEQWLRQNPSREISKKLELLEQFATGKRVFLRYKKSRNLHLSFWESPVELHGNSEGRLVAITLRENRPVRVGDTLRAEPTDRTRKIDMDLVFRSVGYRSEQLPGLPFNESTGTLPHREGRILDQDKAMTGLYAAGWVKRGPTGIIGTNKTCARETAESMLDDFSKGQVLSPSNPSVDDARALVMKLCPAYITYADWNVIDEAEVWRGEQLGRPRVKFTHVENMLQLLRH